MQLAITPLDGPSQVVLKTGIDATQTNSGRQHLDEISVRVFDQNCMQGVYETQDRVSDVVISAFCRLSAGSESCFTAKNRRISAHYDLNVSQGDTVTLERSSGSPTAVTKPFRRRRLRVTHWPNSRCAQREATHRCWRALPAPGKTSGEMRGWR